MTPDDLARTYQDAVRLIVQRVATKGFAAHHDLALLRDIHVIFAELDQKALSWFQETVPAQYRTGMSATLAAIESPVAASLGGVHRAAVEALVANAYGDIRESNVRAGRHIQDRLRQLGLETATRRAAAGVSQREAARSMAAQLVQEGLTPPRHMRPDAYVRLVANTTTREANNLGRINTAREHGHDLVRMSVHHPTCNICAAYQGRVYSISGGDARFPALYETVLAEGYHTPHPHCRHSFAVLPRDGPAELSALEFSNRPFDDPRPRAEQRAYQEAQTRKRRARETRYQWERYRAKLGDDVPGLASFASMKARDTEGYRELLADYRRIDTGG